jgi:hypothetical protein
LATHEPLDRFKPNRWTARLSKRETRGCGRGRRAAIRRLGRAALAVGLAIGPPAAAYLGQQFGARRLREPMITEFLTLAPIWCEIPDRVSTADHDAETAGRPDRYGGRAESASTERG